MLFFPNVPYLTCPKSKVDSVTVMEKIGHFLDDAVHKIYRDLKKEGYNKQEASPLIEKRLKISKILKKASKDWDGGYAMAGLLGHGDAFVLRDPSAIRPAYFFKNDEVAVVASERPVIQTVFNTKYEDIQELEAGHSIIIKIIQFLVYFFNSLSLLSTVSLSKFFITAVPKPSTQNEAITVPFTTASFMLSKSILSICDK